MVEQVGSHYILLGTGNRSGGLSTIRKGTDTRDGSFVAVKFVVGPTDELSRKIFEREYGALRQLSHPNIVRLREAGIDETGTFYIVLDWVERNLNDLLSGRPWNDWLELFDTLARPLVDGLAYAHLKQLEHRDIKPANVLIDAAGTPMLADFGIAKLRGDEPHSELTVQRYRSGAYAPPELDAPAPYVRDVYSVGVLLLQCLSEAPIRDYPDVLTALETARVPPDLRTLLERCVSPNYLDRPANASVLASELVRIARQHRVHEAKERHPIYLNITRSAQTHLVGDPPNRDAAEAKLIADLGGPVFANYGLDRETGRRDPNTIFLYGSEHRYKLRPEDPGFAVIAAPSPEFEQLEGGRRHATELPPIFTWIARHPANPQLARLAQGKLVELVDDYYESLGRPDSEITAQDGDELFDLWLEILEARADLSRGENQPMSYKRAEHEGRRTIFTLTEPLETELVGTDWEVMDQQSGRRFGHGELIDQEAETVTLLSRRPLTGLPQAATLVAYDRPSAIALERQRNAVLAVKAASPPALGLRDLLVDPSNNAEPQPEEVVAWHSQLDPLKQRAVQLALGARELLVVQGPPGTGKTRFITETVSQLLARRPEARVLIASQTHVAVDNAVERLHAAGVSSLVRLAGDEAAVQPAIRDLLLDKQIRKWSESVRERAEAHVSALAAAHGVDPSHLRAALTLQQLAAVATELDAVESHARQLQADWLKDSDLETALGGQDAPADEYQDRIDHLADRKRDLAIEAERLLAGDLTIPHDIGPTEARSAVEVLVGELAGSRELLVQLELQAAWLERIGAEDSLAPIFLSGTSVVAGTCTGFLRERAVADLEFDLCIVDEASKATLTEALVPLARSKRWILVGDTRQLPPSDEDLLRATSILDDHGLSRPNISETLFQRLVDHLPAHSQLMLEEQHRMVRPIGDLISTCFYDGKLRSPKTSGLPGYDKILGRTVAWIDTSSIGEPRREQGETSYANRAEVDLLVRQLDRIERAVDFGLVIPGHAEPLEVLAIAPYKAQVEQLRRRLASKTYNHLVVEVLSVDAVQGREADIALVSLTRSNAAGRLGFLGADYWRRINVALSRARFGLTILGDASFIRGTNGALKTVLAYIEGHPADCIVIGADRG